MNYALLFYLSPTEFAARTDPDKKEAYWGNFMPYMNSIREAGIFVTGAGLEPPEDASVVKVRNGQLHVQDGPYADTKEQLGGFFVIDVPDLDTALKWAALYPAGPLGSVEVRPALRRES